MKILENLFMNFYKFSLISWICKNFTIFHEYCEYIFKNFMNFHEIFMNFHEFPWNCHCMWFQKNSFWKMFNVISVVFCPWVCQMSCHMAWHHMSKCHMSCHISWRHDIMIYDIWRYHVISSWRHDVICHDIRHVIIGVVLIDFYFINDIVYERIKNLKNICK